MLVPVEGTPYVKDTNTNALLTVNRTAIEQNEARKRLSISLNTKAEDINNMKTQIAGLNQDLSEIKQMLKQLMLREN
jgi:hypothetical protein